MPPAATAPTETEFSGWHDGDLICERDKANCTKKTLTQHTYRDVSPRIRIVTSCSLSNLRYENRTRTGGPLDQVIVNDNKHPPNGPIRSYRPGSGWRGDFLDNLYNIGGLDGSNRLRIGIINAAPHGSRGTFLFDVGCTAQLLTRPTPNAGKFDTATPFPIDGLVFTDAESAGYYRSNQEFVEARTSKPALWFLLDRNTESLCQPNGREHEPAIEERGKADAAYAIYNQAARTIRLLPNGQECAPGGYGQPGTPGAVLFAQGVQELTAKIQGRGIQAAALGFIIPRDLGDAPLSYGEAIAHVPTNVDSSFAERHDEPDPAVATNNHEGRSLPLRCHANPRCGR